MLANRSIFFHLILDSFALSSRISQELCSIYIQEMCSNKCTGFSLRDNQEFCSNKCMRFSVRESRMTAHARSPSTRSQSYLQYCQLVYIIYISVYIYTKFEKCCWCSKYLVYNFLIWYVWKIWCYLAYFCQRVWLVIQTNFFGLLQSGKRETEGGVKAIPKLFVILLNIGRSMDFG